MDNLIDVDNWLKNKITNLEFLKRNSYNEFLNSCDETFQTILKILQNRSLEYISIDLLDYCVEICLEKSNFILRAYQLRQFGSSLFLSYLCNRTSFDRQLLFRLLTHFNYYNSQTKLALHFWKPIGDFVSCYLANNNDYVCALLFLVINTWSKTIITDLERSSIILNSLIKLANNLDYSFYNLLTVDINNDSYVLSHIWSVTKILIENNCLGHYFSSIKDDIKNENHYDSPVIASLINFLSYGSDLANYVTFSKINEKSIFVTYVNSYFKVIQALFEDEQAINILRLGIFRCYLKHSISKISELFYENNIFKNCELFSETHYMINKLYFISEF